MPKNSKTKTAKKPAAVKTKKIEQKNSFWDIFRFGESYTSLILGIIVVIVATITLLSFVKGKNDYTKNSNPNQNQVAVQLKTNTQVTPTAAITNIVTIAPTKTIAKIVTPTTKPTVAPTVNPTTKPTAKPTTAPTLKPTTKPTVAPTAKPTAIVKKDNTGNSQKNQQTISGSTYVVAAGDTLWSIAEKKYNSGYNWVDIQKANKISNPDVLNAGTKLTLPKVTPKVATVTNATNSQKTNPTVQANKISGNSYTVSKGDSLWTIAVRAYGDGYAWTKIASANNLSNPSLIFSGNKLIIPRT